MASPGAALSVQRSWRVASQTAPVVGVMTLVAAFAILLLAAMEDVTAPTTWPPHVVMTHPEPAHPKTGTRWRHVRVLVTNRGLVPAASARHRVVYGSWHTTGSLGWTGETPTPGAMARRWDVRQDLVDMAAAQRRHWMPRNTAIGNDRTDSDDRIANALFGSGEDPSASAPSATPSVFAPPEINRRQRPPATRPRHPSWFP